MSNLNDRTGKSGKGSAMGMLAVRCPDAMEAELDEYRTRLSEDRLGAHVTKADAVRQLLLVGLKAEKERLNY